jgi:acyl-CoA dehydrogenase
MPTPAYQSPWINDDARLFRKTARKFIANEFVPHHARWCVEHQHDADAWTKAGAVGKNHADCCLSGW